MDNLAIFQTPYTPPERTPRETFDWLIEQAVEVDRLGFSEFWCGEHGTILWEAVPSPELVLAAVIQKTKQIKLAPGAHLLPYHHPATLAAQISWMTHLTKGRYILGIGAGAFPSDGYLRGFKDLSENHRMVSEAIEIMNKVWESKPFYYEGEFWKAGYPEPTPGMPPHRDLTPYGGKVEMGLAGFSVESPSIAAAGAGGHLPLSIFISAKQLNRHWETYAEAAIANGRTPSRADHHVLMEMFVAETDEEAMRLAVDGAMGEAWRGYIAKSFQLMSGGRFLPEGMNPDSREAIVYIAGRHWMVGSPETVLRKFRERADAAGGPWGTTMMFGYDYSQNPEPWNRSLALMANEVWPHLKREFQARTADPAGVAA